MKKYFAGLMVVAMSLSMLVATATTSSAVEQW